jgi:hypothetical protein
MQNRTIALLSCIFGWVSLILFVVAMNLPSHNDRFFIFKISLVTVGLAFVLGLISIVEDWKENGIKSLALQGITTSLIFAFAFFCMVSTLDLEDPLPEKCTFPPVFSCTGWQVNYDSIEINLQNTAGRDMNIIFVTGSSDALSTSGPCIGTLNRMVRSGDNFTLQLDGCPYVDTGRGKNRYLLNVTYTWVDSPTILHQMSGELLAKHP